MVNGARLVYCHERGGNNLISTISRLEHQRVIQQGIDVPEQEPTFKLPLSSVGISGKTVWIKFKDEHLGRLPFKAEIMVNLAGETRGIHMSRIEQSITDLYETPFTDLREYAINLGEKVAVSQGCSCGTIILQGTVPLLRQTPVSSKLSTDTVALNVTADFTQLHGKSIWDVMIGASLHHITACPCTMTYNQHLFNLPESPCPPATHSQRSITELQIQTDFSGPAPFPSYDGIIDCMIASLHTAHDLLKRPDEAELILKAHNKPQFAEDAVRETARSVKDKFGGLLPASTRVIISSLSLESIHIHDVKCRADVTLADILNVS